MGDSALVYINDQLRSLFGGLSYNDPDVLVFYDMAGHFSDSSWWVNYNDVDTTNLYLWSTMYEELWWGQFDTTIFDDIGEFYTHTSQHMPDTVDIGLFRLDYYMLKDSVFFDSTYYYWDSINETLLDNPNRASEPYSEQRVFMATAFNEWINTLEVTYKINPANILTDDNNDFTLTKDTLIIDFADGNGWQVINPTGVSYHHVSYDTSGTVVLRAAVTQDGTGDTIDFSQFNTVVNGIAGTADTPDSAFTADDMDIGIWYACDPNDSNSVGKKYIFFVEGFDFMHSLGVNDYYRSLKRASLSELRNFGYNIVIVNWRLPGDAIEDNAMRLARLLDNTKCNLSTGDLDTLHQFVVIGESMGGLVARYALAWMEANPGSLLCRPDLMHNTRLFISFDAPQDGAYVPMAFQELANHFNLFTHLPFNMRTNMRNYWDMLNCQAAQDMLKVHQSTNPWNTYPNWVSNSTDAVYTAHNRRDQLEDDLHDLVPATDGYPEHCKLFAISNGLLTGEHQVRLNGTEAQPGDNYLDGEAQLDLTVLGVTFPIQNAELLLSSPDGNAGDFFRYQRGMRFWRIVIPTQTYVIGFCPFCIKIKAPAGLPTIQFDYITSKEIKRFSTTCPPWDFMPGGFYDFAPIADAIPQGRTPIFLPRVVCGAANTNCRIDMDGLQIGNLDVDLDVFNLGFNFIPIQSALDYNIPGQPDPLDDNIYTENINVMLGRTPFDVIVGEVNGLAGYPQTQLALALERNEGSQWEYPAYNRAHATLYNHRRNDSLINSNTSLYNNPLFAFYLNREIGDEELMLENFDLNRTAWFETEYIIRAGTQLNPYYEYPGQAAQQIFAPYDISNVLNIFGYNLNNNGIFSKENTFNVSGGSNWAVLKADSIIDPNVNGGMTGNHQDIFLPQLVCVLDFYCFPDTTNCSASKRGEGSKKQPGASGPGGLSLWPNPARPDEQVQVNTQGHYYSNIRLTNASGTVLMNERLSYAYHTMNLDLAHLRLTPGVYFLTLVDGYDQHTHSLKLIVL